MLLLAFGLQVEDGPLPAASIIMAMMLLPSTIDSGVRIALTWHGYLPAIPTNFADARACKPSLLMISISSAGIAGLILSSKVAVANLDVFQGFLQALAQALRQVKPSGDARLYSQCRS